ncbi:MAG: PH domain-containing protein [Muribaculaceae bacterium]|nr:PH domain-containing protein [Muribaculaceae bacterium]
MRGLTYKWEWFPIDKIESIKPIKSILASSALSYDRIAINFSDRKERYSLLLD